MELWPVINSWKGANSTILAQFYFPSSKHTIQLVKLIGQSGVYNKIRSALLASNQFYFKYKMITNLVEK